MLSTIAVKFLTVAIASNISTPPDASAPGRDCVAVFAPVDDGPDTPASRRVRLLAMSADAEKLMVKRQWEKAAEVLGRCVALAEMLHADAPNDRAAAVDLIAALNSIGQARAGLDQFPEATAFFRRALALCEKLAESDPKNADVRYLLPGVMMNLGGTISDREPKRAAELYERAIAACEKIVAADPKDRRALLFLRLALDSLGDLQLNVSGETREAVETFRRSSVVAEKLAADPEDRVAQRDLLMALGGLGKALARSGRSKEAAEIYSRGSILAEKILLADPKSVRARLELIGVYGTVARFEWSRGRSDAAIRQYQKAIDIGSVADAPEELVEALSNMRYLMSILRATVAVIADPDGVGKLEESSRAPALTEAFPVLLAKEEFVKAKRVAELLGEVGTQVVDFYEATRMFSNLAAIGDGDQKEKDALRAVDMLRVAVCYGLWNARALREDLDLAALQDRSDFRAILADLERTAKPPSPPKK